MTDDVNDDVSLQTNASGDTATFATDYVGGKHYPYAKLAFGADNTATLVGSGNPLPIVATTSDTKLDTVISNTGAGGVNVAITPTVTAGAYTTGMVVGGKLSLTNAVRASGGSGIIQAANVFKKTALTAAFDVIFFNADPSNSTFTDNASLAVNVADLDKIIGVISCGTLVSLGTPQLLQGQNAGLPFKLATGTTLYAVAVIRGAETYASTSAVILSADIIQA